MMNLTVQPITHEDIALFLPYWYTAEPGYMRGMGVDMSKLPPSEQLAQMMSDQLDLPIEQRRSYCILWYCDDEPVGHSNTNPTTFGVEGSMHLHIWQAAGRQKGLGTQFVQLSVAHYFETLRLQKLWCEPYALNPGPNKTLEKVGFELVREYVTVPGFICFEQPVKRWELTRQAYDTLKLTW